MRNVLTGFAEGELPRLEARLRELCPRSTLEGTGTLNEAVMYAVSSGGKRVRPLLTLLAARVFRAPEQESLDLACGVEFLHLSSVILDDLPAMDDAKTRRHRPALHVVYGEAVAILAALAFYAQAFGIFARFPAVAREAACAVGCDGMTGGQAADLQGAGPSRLAKTTALMRFAMRTGGLAGCANEEQIDALGRFGELAGEAYQVCDDLLDALGSETSAGKTVGQDRRHGRPAVVSGWDIDAARGRVARLVEAATKALREALPASDETELLCEFAGSILARANELVETSDVDPGGSRRVASAGGGECGVVAARSEADG